jgi:predicted enzyme related to lactoylglutathione lyase
MSLFKNVNVVSYYVTDWEKAKKFYGEVLEWPIAYASDEFGWVEYGREGEAHIAINRWEPREGHATRPPANGGATLVLTVDDARKVTEALRKKGVKCDDVVEIPGVVTYGTFYDPEGNRIQFAESAPPQN